MDLRPTTEYARSGDVSIAYQVFGDAPHDLVFIWGLPSNIDLIWEEPRAARFLRGLSSFSRVIMFDKRGTGLSDPVAADRLPPLDERMDDVRAVMDAAGSERASLLGFTEGGQLGILFAATYPERTTALVLWGSQAAWLWSEDYPWGSTREESRRRWLEPIKETGRVELAEHQPSEAGDPEVRRWYERYVRNSASPALQISLLRMNAAVDLRAVLPAIRVPTLVLHRTDDAMISVEHGRYIARRVPGARLLELPGRDHWPWFGEDVGERVLSEIEHFLTGSTHVRSTDRSLATLAFVDVVGSTVQAERLGDRSWTTLLTTYRDAIARTLSEHRGQAVNWSGDGLLALFDAPGRSVEWAIGAREQAARIGLELRSGIHTGEIERVGDDITGIAVHLAARIADAAAPGEILVSRTVTDLIVGSGIEFEDRGEHELAGIAAPWRLFAVRGRAV